MPTRRYGVEVNLLEIAQCIGKVFSSLGLSKWTVASQLLKSPCTPSDVVIRLIILRVLALVKGFITSTDFLLLERQISWVITFITEEIYLFDTIIPQLDHNHHIMTVVIEKIRFSRLITHALWSAMSTINFSEGKQQCHQISSLSVQIYQNCPFVKRVLISPCQVCRVKNMNVEYLTRASGQ